MATSNSRDVQLGISVTTDGEQQIAQLEQQVKDLAKAGGAANPAFEELQQTIRRLGEQQAAVAAVGALADKIEKVAAAQAEAQQRVEKGAESLREYGSRAAEAAKGEEVLRAEQKRLQDELFATNQSLTRLRAGYGDFEKGTTAYRNEVGRLVNAKLALNAAIRDQGVEIKAAAQVTKQAAEQETAAAAAHDKSVNALGKLNTEQTKLNTKMAEAQSALRATAAGTDDLALAQQRLAASVSNANKALDQQESDRLAGIIAKSKAAQAAAGQQALDAERANYADSEAFVRRYEQQKIEAAQRAAAAAKQAAAEEQAESDRLARIVIANQEAMRRAAFARLDEERANARDSAAAVEAYEARKAAAARESANQLNAAYATVGTRSLEQIKADALGVERAVNLMNAEFQQGRISAESLARGVSAARLRVQELHAEAAKTPAMKGQFLQLSETIGGIINRFGALGAAVGAVGFAFKPILDAVTEMDSMRRALTTVTGSAAEAEKSIQFLSETANRAGVPIADMTESFIRFSASSRSAGISADVVNKVFENTVVAAGNLGLSGDKVTHILDALAQMASKGVVSMEELRQQLGDSLPGALNLMAEGLGLTQAELVKVVESGKLLSVDALPALADAMLKLGPAGQQVEGVSATFARMRNVVTELLRTIGDGGAWQVFMTVLGAVAGVLRDISVVVVGFDQALRGVFSTLGAVVDLFNGSIPSLSAFGDRLSDIWAGAGGKIQSYIDKAYASSDANDAAAASAERMGAATGASAASIERSAAAIDASAEAAGRQGAAQQAAAGAAQSNVAAQGQLAVAAGGAATAAQSNATAQAAAGAATAQAGVQAASSATSWVRLSLDMTTAADAAERQVSIAEKQAQAMKVQGDAAQALAQLSADSTDQLIQAAAAAGNNAAALSNLAAARGTEVALLQTQRTAMLEAIKQLGDSTGARQKEVDALTQTIAKKQAELELARQTAEGAKNEAAARSTAVAAVQDNATALDALRAAYQSATAVVGTYVEAVRVGAATDTQLADAKRQAAVAEALYRDAISDTSDALDRRVATIQQDSALAQARLGVRQAENESERAYAELIGNSARSVQAQIEGKQLEIASIRESIAAKREEAAATVAQAQAEREELTALGSLTPEKAAEIQQRINNAQIMQLEQDARTAGIGKIEIEIDSLRRLSQQAGATGVQVRQVADSLGKLQQQQLQLQQQQNKLPPGIALWGKNGSTTGDGGLSGVNVRQVSDLFGPGQGNITGSYELTALASLRQKQQAGTLSASDLELAQKAYDAALNNTSAIRSGDRAGVGMSLSAVQSVQRSLTDAKAILDEVNRLSTDASRANGAQDNSSRAIRDRRNAANNATSTDTTSTSSSSGGTRTVNLKINGTSFGSINTDASGEAAIDQLLTLLEQAQGRS